MNHINYVFTAVKTYEATICIGEETQWQQLPFHPIPVLGCKN